MSSNALKKEYAKDEKIDKRRNDGQRINFGDVEKGEIDLHDLVVSLAILSTLPYDEKLELCFDLTDIDEDGCLSPDDVCKMMLAIERNFAKECSFIDSENASSLNYVATKKALRRFNYLFLYEGQEDAKLDNKGKPRKDKVLSHFKDFMERLTKKQNLYNNLLPQNYSLRRVLDNKAKEVAFKIHKNEEDQFKKFRSELHGRIWGGKGDCDPRSKSMAPKKEDSSKLPNKEPGDVFSYGIRTIEEEPKYHESKHEQMKHREPMIMERSNLPEYRKKVFEMKEKRLPNLEMIIGGRHEKIKKDNYLPPVTKWPSSTESRHVEIETPDLNSMVEKRVERLKKQYKHLDVNYKDYLLKKLTTSMEDASDKNVSVMYKKNQAYKFLI